MFSQNASTASTRPAPTERFEPGPARLVDVAPAVLEIFLRQRVQAQIGRPDRHRQIALERARHFQQAPFARKIQSVAGLHFDGGNPFGHQPLRAHRSRCTQLGGIRGAGGVDGRLDAATGARDVLIGNAAQPLLELIDTIAAVDQVRVAIDEPRRHPQAAAILDRNILCRGPASAFGGRADPGDALALHRERIAFELAIRFGTRDHRARCSRRSKPGPIPCSRMSARARPPTAVLVFAVPRMIRQARLPIQV